MKAKIKVRVLAAKRFNMEGNAMSQVYVEGEFIEEADKIGCPPMKMNGDFDVLDKLRGNMPGFFELTVELRAGAQDKMTQYCLDATPTQTPTPAQTPSKAA
ncbi:MAG: hypothetical protein ACKVJE_22225 [Pseudomonadales bacterium]